MYAEGRVQVVRKDLLAVPRSAVLDDGETARVWVESSPGVFDHRVVRIGFRGDHHWELAAGVVADERVAINGAALLDSQIKL
jgi:hypothetical protein